MSRFPAKIALVAGVAFVAGFLSHFLYQRWSPLSPAGRGYPVTFAPLPQATGEAEVPVVQAREIEKIRTLAGSQARVRGRIYRVGHSTKSNTYFLNFGPSRSSFTGVIFSSALEAFEKRRLNPKRYEGREVELTGEVKNHPKYGLEMILEDPRQIKLID